MRQPLPRNQPAEEAKAMTPHQTQIHLDGSVSIRIFAGGRWKVLSGPANGTGDVFDCDASRFCDRQNYMAVRDFHQKSVREYMGKGEAA